MGARSRGPLSDDRWQLYDTAVDFACANDLAAKHPDKLEELQAAFLEEAVKYNVLPLDDRLNERLVPSIAGRPDIMEGRTSLTVYPGMIGMPDNAFIDVKNKSSRSPPISTSRPAVLRASSWPRAACTAAGACTSRTTGRSLPTTSWAPSRPSLPPTPARRPVTVHYDFDYDGGGLGKGGIGDLSVNGATSPAAASSAPRR